MVKETLFHHLMYTVIISGRISKVRCVCIIALFCEI